MKYEKLVNEAGNIQTFIYCTRKGPIREGQYRSVQKCKARQTQDIKASAKQERTNQRPKTTIQEVIRKNSD